MQKSWDGVAVVRQVAVVGVPKLLVGCLQLHQEERDAIDEANQVRATGIEVALHPNLTCQQEVVVRRVEPVDQTHTLWFETAVILS